MDQRTLLFNLGVVIVAVGAVWLLLRVTDRSKSDRGGVLPGYPPDLVPARSLNCNPQLESPAGLRMCVRQLSMLAAMPSPSCPGER